MTYVDDRGYLTCSECRELHQIRILTTNPVLALELRLRFDVYHTHPKRRKRRLN